MDAGRQRDPSSNIRPQSSPALRAPASDRPALARAIVFAVPAVLLAAITFTTVHDYFWTLRKDPFLRLIYFSEMTTASDYMRALPPDTFVLFYSERASINLETRQFLAPDVQGVDRSAEFNPANTSPALPPALVRSARGRATTPVWTFPPPLAHPSTLLQRASSPTPESAPPAGGLEIMSPSSTRMAPTP